MFRSILFAVTHYLVGRLTTDEYNQLVRSRTRLKFDEKAKVHQVGDLRFHLPKEDGFYNVTLATGETMLLEFNRTTNLGEVWKRDGRVIGCGLEIEDRHNEIRYLLSWQNYSPPFFF